MKTNDIKIRKGPVGIDNVLNLGTRIHGNGKEGYKPKYSKKDRRWDRGNYD